MGIEQDIDSGVERAVTICHQADFRPKFRRNTSDFKIITIFLQAQVLWLNYFTSSSGVRDSPSLWQHWQQKQPPQHAIFVDVL